MNDIAFESGAGTSLLYGPVLNPNGVTGGDALKLAQDWVFHMAAESNASHTIIEDATVAPLGWPGLWPILQPFSSWHSSDPSSRLLPQLGRQSRRETSARKLRLRMRLHDVAFAESRRPSDPRDRSIMLKATVAVGATAPVLSNDDQGALVEYLRGL